ncbi:SDR family NAD(P)-dependent oxidoreductase [Sphingobium boeckii]|uniref:Meso-butanediol dehydrogenase/(S,S)-butanediol dehydrogenase/diacetyl reductase n=1 Tax=Sphingobium boeckii TaxID=1082345 RepID=A0A7W9EE78_9SPHN|nr:glucose 1-dehydrogenase [Sphingobium boeckii]MBB5685907.1 meso-butanediol dehydrogenase/(S,S)-butanediol dehydrogenase/diacetyl reductase [Sphingobium boeckii]
MTGRLNGKVAIVTGGASGIGEATVRRLHADGAAVVVADVRPEAIEALSDALQSDRIIGLRVDMMQTAEIEAMIAATVARCGGLDILVNNAGIGSFGRVTDIDLAHWREVMTIDVEAVMWASRTAMPFLAARQGCIVNVASVAGIAGDYGFAAYNAAKAAVINLTRAMALDHAPQVRVNVVSPGLTRTPLAEGLTGNAEIMAAWTDGLPMGRPAEPAEVAAAIAFLASPDASYINGHNLVVDGGGIAHTGMPNFTRILGGASHLDGMASAVKRDTSGEIVA